MNTYPIYTSPDKEKNEEKYGNGSNTCVCCARPTTGNLFIHATTDWKAVDTLDEKEVPNSQGCFDIGSDCAKKFPKAFIFKKNKDAKG